MHYKGSSSALAKSFYLDDDRIKRIYVVVNTETNMPIAWYCVYKPYYSSTMPESGFWVQCKYRGYGIGKMMISDCAKWAYKRDKKVEVFSDAYSVLERCNIKKKYKNSMIC